MAKQGKLAVKNQRYQPEDEDSVLLRSAESIGRVIGTLQRQLDGARNRLQDVAGKSHGATHADTNGRGKTAKTAARAKPSATKGTRKAKKSARTSGNTGRVRKPR
jgi:hypothetical protein